MSRIPQEEACPISESLFGDLYRAPPGGLHALIESLSHRTRALLAVYCSKRAHLATLGLAIASTCERHEMIRSGGQFGAVIFANSRQAPPAIRETRRRVTVSSSLFMAPATAKDLI